jgi:hypothetical protein
MGAMFPMIKIAGYRDTFGIGRPNGEVNAWLAVHLYDVTAELFMNLEVLARLEKGNIKFSKQTKGNNICHLNKELTVLAGKGSINRC